MIPELLAAYAEVMKILLIVVLFILLWRADQ